MKVNIYINGIETEITLTDSQLKEIKGHSSELLSGKCAIQVSNEGEFNLLMEHYKAKGWSEHIKYSHPNFGTTHRIIEYSDGYLRIDESNILATIQYKIINFSDFAKEIGIKTPEFIMTSEDMVDLYGGMEMYGVNLNPSLNIWELNNFHITQGLPFVLTDAKCEPDEDFPYITVPSRNKAFSTLEAAEIWCLEMNKPMLITIPMKNTSTNYAEVRKGGVSFYSGKDSPAKWNLNQDEINEVYEAYKSLQ